MSSFGGERVEDARYVRGSALSGSTGSSRRARRGGDQETEKNDQTIHKDHQTINTLLEASGFYQSSKRPGRAGKSCKAAGVGYPSRKE
jgi:hypothetical protein